MSKNRMGSRERAEKCLLDLQMACYHAVHDYPGGAGAIAAMANINMAVLQNKLNPNTKPHAVNIRDFQSICEITQDERLLQTVCGYFNAGYFMVPTDAEIEHETLLQQSADLSTEVSGLLQTVSTSLRGGRVNQDEVSMLEKKLLELFRSAKTLVEHAKLAGDKT